MTKPATPSPRPLICFVAAGTGEGGDGRYLLELVCRLNRERYRLAVISLDLPGVVGHEIQQAGVPVHTLDLPGGGGPWRGFLGVTRLHGLLRHLRPDLVHTVGFEAGLFGRPIARMARVGRVLCTWRRPEDARGFSAFLARLFAGTADLHLALGESMVAHTRKRWNLHPRRVRKVDPGVDFLRIKGWPKAPDLPGGKPVIGFVGSLAERKGLTDLLQAALLLRRHHPRLCVLIAGSGPQGPALQRQIERHGLTGQVHLLGERGDAGRIHAALDLFVLPSRREGLARVLIEAAVAGRPIVATDIRGVRDFIENEVHGLLVPPGKPALLADAVDRLLQDPAAGVRLAAAARARARAHHRIHQMVAHHMNLYESLLFS